MTGLIPDPAAARAMLDLFASVGVTAFDVTLKTLEGMKAGFQSNRSADELRRSITKRLDTATAAKVNIIIRPRPDAKLVQLDDLDRAQSAKVAPHSFLMFETSPGNFQAWVALDGQAEPGLARRVKRGAGADVTASGATRLAGSFNFKPKYAPGFPRVEITHSAAGRTTTPAALEMVGLVAPREETELAPRRASREAPRGSPRRWPDYGRNLAAAPRDREGKPDRSNADFVWCMTAIDWGWSVDATAARLCEVSEKARERIRQHDDGYPRVTAERAADAVYRKRAASQKKPPVSTSRPG